MRYFALILTLAIAIFTFAPAQAARIDVDNLNSIHVFSNDGVLNAEGRVKHYHFRLNQGITYIQQKTTRRLTDKDIVLKRNRRNSYTIYVGPCAVLNVTKLDGRDYCTSTSTLANRWFRIIRNAVVSNQAYTAYEVRNTYVNHQPAGE